MRGQWYVAFYNVLGALADAVHELPFALAKVLLPRPVAHFLYSLQRLLSWLILSALRYNVYHPGKCPSADVAPHPVQVEG